MFNRKLKEENVALKHEVEMLKFKNNTLSDDIYRSLDKIDVLSDEINTLKLDNVNLTTELNKYSKADLIELDKQIKDKQSTLSSIESKLSEVDNKLYLQSINFDDIVEPSQYYKDEIKRNRIKQKDLFRSKQHYSINEEWYIDGDDKKGNMLSMFLISTCVSSFNMMCDSLSKSVNASNYVNLSNKIERDFNSYNDKLSIFELKLNRNLLDLKLQEIKLYRDVSIKLQQEKEEREYQHEVLREQLKATLFLPTPIMVVFVVPKFNTPVLVIPTSPVLS